MRERDPIEMVLRAISRIVRGEGDPDEAISDFVVDVWPTLTPRIRAAIEDGIARCHEMDAAPAPREVMS